MKKFVGFIAFLLAVACVVIGFVVGAFGYIFYTGEQFVSETYSPRKVPVFTSGDLQIHFLELGNAYTGDCTYIKAGDTDILIDAGSKVTSVSTISAYLDQYVTDNTLEYVIVTHAHEDHYAGFATNENVDSLFDLYVCNTIIDFAFTNQKETAKMYSNYCRELADEVAAGATHLTALDCIEQNKTVWQLSDDVIMTILDQKYYHEKDSSGENNHSVCTLFTQGENNFLFTGDLEEKGERSLIESNNIPNCTLYKAGHHGSKTSSSEQLMAVVRPDIVCVCCCAGSAEYTDVNVNQFPTQIFIDNVAPYTDQVYVTSFCVDWDKKKYTSFNGNITVHSGPEGVSLTFSGSNQKLKESDWFKANRTCPEEWK